MSESITIDKSLDKAKQYEQLLLQIKSLVEGETDLTANLANICAALKYGMNGFFWVGFYFVKGDELIFGPFQGPVACKRIKIEHGGVCAAAVKEKRTIVVDDVNTFPGHIACSAESKSEIVVPILKGGKVFGVLDVDSDSYAQFNQTDAEYLEELCLLVLELTGN